MAWQFPSDPLVLQWQDDAWQRMWHALDTAFGGLPPDLEAEPLVMRGNPGPVLVGAASRDRDTLVVGAGVAARSAASGTARSAGTAWPTPAAR